MTAVAVLVQDAMYAARVLGQDQTVQSGDAQLVLRRLNRMLDSWSNEKQMIFSTETDTFLMTANVGTYSTSLLAGGRPVDISSIMVSLNNLDYPVTMIDQQLYNTITYKIVAAIPNQCFYNPSYPDGQLNFYPRPYAPFLCSVNCQRLLTAPLTLTTVLALPPGYEAAIVAGLAVDISTSFGKQPTPAMVQEMTQTRSVLKRTNYQPLEMVTGMGPDNADISNAFLYKGW